MQDLDIILIQTSIVWESFEKNLEMFDNKFCCIDGKVDLIVLPEMFATGFSMNPSKIAQTMDGEIINWLRNKAIEKRTNIVGSVAVLDKGKYYNRLLWANYDGVICFYDKKHLFRFAEEDKYYFAGDKKVIVNCRGWNVALFICYDLRFPVWVRNIRNEYDIALFVANWPSVRFNAWKNLLVARAIENQSYVIGVNRVGFDGNGIDYRGDSSVINPNGFFMVSSKFKETILRCNLSFNDLRIVRQMFPVWKDADILFGGKIF